MHAQAFQLFVVSLVVMDFNDFMKSCKEADLQVLLTSSIMLRLSSNIYSQNLHMPNICVSST